MDSGHRHAPGSLADEQAALRRVAAIAAAGQRPEAVFNAVTAEASGLLGGTLLALMRFERAGAETVVVARTGDHVDVGTRLQVAGDSIAARMWRSGRAERIDDYTDLAGTRLVEELGLRAAVAAPVTVDGNLWGSLGASSRTGPLPAGTEDRLTMFAEIAAAAVGSATARESARLLADEQAALLRVAALVADGAPENEIFDAVAVEAAGLIDDQPTTLVRYLGDRRFTVLATRNGPAPIGTRFTVPADDAGTSSEMLRTLKPARLDHYDDIADRSYASKDFGVGSSVSVPIMVNGRLWGSLGTLNEGRRLPDGTEQRLAKFAELVSSALANVQARAELKRFGHEQAALRRVAEVVARGAALEEVFTSVAIEASTIMGESAANLFRFDVGHVGTVVATCRSPVPVGLRFPTDGGTVSARLIKYRRALRVSAPAGSDLTDIARDLRVEALVAVPIVVEGQTWGGLSITTAGEPPAPDAEDRLVEFAELAATAIASAQNQAKLTASRARVVATADETRKRLQRDLHDGAQQRLVQTVVTLQLGLAAAERGNETTELIREALWHAKQATTELRDLVHGILPASLTRGGLGPGLESLIAGLALEVELDLPAGPPGRLAADIEVTAYFVAAEALTNIVKHARAGRVQVCVVAEDALLRLEITDDGIGGADPRGGTGLTGLSDRVEAMNGTLLLTSDHGVGTTVRVTLPIQPRLG